MKLLAAGARRVAISIVETEESALAENGSNHLLDERVGDKLRAYKWGDTWWAELHVTMAKIAPVLAARRYDLGGVTVHARRKLPQRVQRHCVPKHNVAIRLEAANEATQLVRSQSTVRNLLRTRALPRRSWSDYHPRDGRGATSTKSGKAASGSCDASEPHARTRLTRTPHARASRNLLSDGC